MQRTASICARTNLAFALSVLSLHSNVARAQTDVEVAARRQLIEDARRASTAGDHARAVDLATRAARLRMTPSLRAFLAAEQLATGQVVRAISNAEQCVNELRRDTTVNERARLLEDCQRIVEDAGARVGRVSVEGVSESLPGLVIRVQGEPLNAALIGVATVVDPGTVVVEVSATGYRPQRQEIRVEPRQTTVVRVTLEREQPAASNTTTATSAASVAQATQGVAEGSDPPPRAERRSRPSLVGPIAVTAAGGAVLATGGLFFGLQAMAFGDCRVEDNENVCVGRTTVDQATPAVTFNRVAIATTILGAAAVVGGVTWLVVASRSGREAPSTMVAPTADATSAGLVVRGAL